MTTVEGIAIEVTRIHPQVLRRRILGDSATLGAEFSTERSAFDVSA
jgi:hypothetical protein